MNIRMVAVAALLFVLGCSGGKPLVFPVRGQVLDAAGKPAVGAIVIFHAAGADNATIRPVARVADDGVFRLTTFAENDGAPAGEYAVTVLWPTPRKAPFEPEGPDRLKGAYADPAKSQIRYTVKAGTENEVPPIRLP